MTNLDINKAYIGDAQVEKIYLGTDVVYEATPVGPTGHTASVLLDDSVAIDLPETAPDMYEMAFTEPYTSITLYYDDEVVTASTLGISVDGSQSTTETDYEVANINTDTYGFSSINSISFYADSNDVYIDFTP
jgi:hypothetical protein